MRPVVLLLALVAASTSPALAQERAAPPTATAAATATPTAAARGSLRGRVRLAVPGVRIEDMGALVVFLDGREGRLAYDIPAAVPKIHQRDARFIPGFLIVAAGQSVEMPNDDAIVHNVFSYSKPNEFDLKTYPGDTSTTVTLRHPGVVRVYCSIHASMNATIFVAPSPYACRAGPDGAFEIPDVPAGEYMLRTWNHPLPPQAIPIVVKPGAPTEVAVAIGESR